VGGAQKGRELKAITNIELDDAYSNITLSLVERENFKKMFVILISILFL